MIFTRTSQNNEREEASLGKAAHEEVCVDLNDIIAPVGKCKQRAEITLGHGMWGMTRLKPSIGESESVRGACAVRVDLAVPSETAERCLRNCSFVRSCKYEVKS